MIRLIRRVAPVGLLATVLLTGLSGESRAGGLGFTETVYVDPLVETGYYVPTTYTASTSYLLPTRYVLRPRVYSPTVYSTSYVVPTRTVVRRPLFGGTRYLLGGTLAPTRYVVDDVYPTSFSSYSYSPYPTVYGLGPMVYSPVVGTAMIVDDRPVTRAQRAPVDSSARRAAGTREPGLEDPGDLPATGGMSPPSSPELPAPGSLDDGDLDTEFRQNFRPTYRSARPSSAARRVSGRVRSQYNGDPMEGLTVTFKNANPNTGDRVAVTDVDGRFILDQFLPDGDWTVLIAGAGDDAEVTSYPALYISRGLIYDQEGEVYSDLLLNY